MNIPKALKTILSTNPDALLFGTDSPSTRAPRPYNHGDLELVAETLTDETLLKKVLYSNAITLYRQKTNAPP